jgi:hypothetical protein
VFVADILRLTSEIYVAKVYVRGELQSFYDFTALTGAFDAESG